MKDQTQLEQSKRASLAARKPIVAEKISRFAEKVQRGESIAIIQLQYRYQCNLKCEHCSIKPFQHRRGRSLRPSDLRRIYDEAHVMGLARTVITGGEPLTFKDLDQVVEAIGPDRFYINCDTNGWSLDRQRAKDLKAMGVDRIQLSIDSLSRIEHDRFRGKVGSWLRALNAVKACHEVGLDLFIQTVVTQQRLHSPEFLEFVEYFNKLGIVVFVTFAKPVGAWAGKLDVMIDANDLAYMRELETRYNVCTHLTPAYGLNMGCIAVKGMVSITQYGDVQPCPYMHITLGNVFDAPLSAIIERGFGIKWFAEYLDTCPIAMDRVFIRNLDRHLEGRKLPAHHSLVFGLRDFIGGADK